MSRYGFSFESVVVLYRAELISAKTAMREFGLEGHDVAILESVLERPAVQAITPSWDSEVGSMVKLVEAQMLSRKTAMGKLGIEDPDRERDDIFMEKLMKRPDVQAFIVQMAQQLARAKYPWRYPR